MLSKFRRHREPSEDVSKELLSGDLNLRDDDSRDNIPDEYRFSLHGSRTSRSAMSSYEIVHRNHSSLANNQRAKDRSRDRRLDPTGLTVLHEPETGPVADIIFVHGLGGSSRQTWSKNRDPALFWPLEWLPLEPVLSKARISTFGYNAHFMSASEPNNILNISDFAKDLLFHLRFATGAKERPLSIGKAPIIFVAHSMGGLVVKRAFILGQHDTIYRDIVQAVSACVFLSTPHRGSNLAESLNHILAACIFKFSPKQYIADLKTNSQTIQAINEEFRNLAPKMAIVSFFETRYTAVGISQVMVVERDSSILGYPGEISKPLTADHHDVCKYISRTDPNYISVRDVLTYLVEKSAPQKLETDTNGHQDEMLDLAAFVGDPEVPLDDQEFFADKRLDGSCEWLLRDEKFTSWYEDTSSAPNLLWCTGKPGSGKSVAAAYLVGDLQKSGHTCAYYFFRFGNQLKNSLTMFLLSMAFQFASTIPEYRRRLLRMYNDGVNITKSAPRLIWQQLYVLALFRITVSKPIYLVVDGLDESDSAPLLLKMFADLHEIKVPVRLLLVSRATPAISQALDRISKKLNVAHLVLDGSAPDLRSYVTEEMQSMHGNEAFKERTIERILAKADGNFLWVHLVVNEVLQCHTEDGVEEALNQVPQDLEPLYERIDETLARSAKLSDQALGRSILMWAACSRYPLTVTELHGALLPEYERVLDLQHTSRQVCGEFIVFDKKHHIAMIHSSAKDYLMSNSALNYYINPQKSHQAMLTKCLKTLMDIRIKPRNDTSKSQAFQFYASTSWPFHLESSMALMDDSSLTLLSRFFMSPAILHWIHFLAVANRLRTLIVAAKTMSSFLRISDKLDKERSPLTHRLQDKDTLYLWSQDLIRIVGKFGTQLVQHPKSIYRIIPQFCPKSSIISNQFRSTDVAALVLRDTVNPTWDDCLARFSLPSTSMPLQITTIDRYFAILTADGATRFYYTNTCEEARMLSHNERVLTNCFNASGDKMATCGLNQTKVWNTRTARLLCKVDNPPRTRALAIAFAENDELLLTCSDDRVIRGFSIAAPQYGWEILGEITAPPTTQTKIVNSPRKARFSPDASLLAIAFRGMPLAIWSINDNGLDFVGQSERPSERFKPKSKYSAHSVDAQSFCWNPISGHVLGVYNDGCIFKWHPYEQDHELSTTRALQVECSIDGKFFVTCSREGALRIWDFNHFIPIYQLSFAASITDLAIDRSESRIYDIRGRFCNVWEPNALVRLLESDEKASDDAMSTQESATNISLFSEANVESVEPISALSVHEAGQQYVVGNEAGISVLYNKSGGRLVELSERFMTVECIAFCHDAHRVASADLSRGIVVEELSTHEGTPLTYSTSNIFVETEQDVIRQLCLNSSGSRLLVVTESFLKVWDIEQKLMRSIMPVKSAQKWLQWSIHPEIVLGFGGDFVTSTRWDNLLDARSFGINFGQFHHDDPPAAELFKRRPSTAYPMSPAELTTTVHRVLVTGDGSIAFIETTQSSTQGRRDKDFFLLDLLPLAEQKQSTDNLIARPIPQELRKHCEISIGFVELANSQSAPKMTNANRRRSSARPPPSIVVSGDFNPSRSAATGNTTSKGTLLVFLSKNFWICTFDLAEGDGGSVRRHFFLPRDWLNMEALEMMQVSVEGTIFCPRNGEVAIIENGLLEEWVD